ncbi:MAG: hypothetical protein LBR48_05080 [Dysgonamonadaceae bacterium]|jgi:hypothetical protein|nr:hypothetical protein [Dysgonamonadaceae bacterium]
MQNTSHIFFLPTILRYLLLPLLLSFIVKPTAQGQESYPMTFTDSQGNMYQVEVEERETDSTSTKVKTTYLGRQTTPVPPDSYDRNRIDNAQVDLTFIPSGKYAFDAWTKDCLKSGLLRNFYQTVGDDYCPPWKLMVEGGTDFVKAKVAPKVEGFNPKLTLFTTPQGTRYEGHYDSLSQEYTLNLASGANRDVQEIYALYPKPDGKYFTLGKLNVLTVARQTVKLEVIEVDGGIKDENTFKTYLDSVYAKVGVGFDISIQKFDYQGEKADFFDKKSGAWQDYNDRMRALIKAYRAEHPTTKGSYYLFVLNSSGESRPESNGFMPRGNTYGFVFVNGGNAQTLSHTAAHELGHGVWSLRHTFDEAYGSAIAATEGTTQNLMDYSSNGTQTAYFQWSAIIDPPLWVNPFEGDEESQLAIFGGITWLGDLLGGLAKDEQEKEVENLQKLLDHVNDNYSNYFDRSKSKNVDITLDNYKDWSVRTESHNGKICQSIYKKFNEKADNSFNLYSQGIYVENYELNGQSYKVAVYSTQSSVELKNDNIRLKGYKDLANNTYVKSGYTKKYGIIAFYGSDKKVRMLLQISGDDTPEKVAEQWLNYLAIVVASDEQKKYDESIWDKIKGTISKLFSKDELPKVWEEESNTETYLNVQWYGQFNEIFKNPCGCWKTYPDSCLLNNKWVIITSNQCCNRAAKKIMSDAGATPGNRVIIAQTDRPCSDKNGTIKYSDNGIIANEANFEQAVQIIDISLFEHKLPIMIGVQHPYKDKYDNWYYRCGSTENNPRATNHFIVIVGKGYDTTKKMSYYNFYEVVANNENDGKSKNNKLWIDTNQYLIKGNVSIYNKEDYYIVTDVRQNQGKEYEIKQ